MANTRELRRRIKSVKNTAQITKAMQMVAATKMRRAQNQALSGRPYSSTLNFSLESLLGKINPEEHKLLQKNNSSKVLVILLSTDKGLAGALNTNLLRATINFMDSRLRGNDRREGGNDKVQFLTVGKKGRSFITRTGKDLEADFENPETVTSRQARQLGKVAIDKFLAEEIGEAYLIYPHFISALRQEPTIVKLLPVDLSALTNSSVISSDSERSADSKSRDFSSSTRNDKLKSEKDNTEFIFEPNAAVLLDFILVHTIETRIYQALLETKASEHSARMLAMQNATDNAKELVEDLNLTYNQTRQDAITRELLEITSASLALE